MTEQTMPQEALTLACGIARGEAEGPPDPVGRLIAATKDINARGRIREWWYRMRWEPATRGWAYITNERLPAGNFRAAERRATLYAEVYVGDLLVTHDRGGPIDPEALLVIKDGAKMRTVPCKVAKRRDGNLSVTLPDGTTLVTPNPRS